ncbi:CHASE2 domain-containing protein [Noviherbaspirillum saxi]|uniref:Adenylate/guanylate cyclase domain-containing protein n=1 Tax=Noviherbaspirillum saxi TaxID=2320863 RepID=A0A3A3FLC2_9BURK|nr:adenylate/guanylate cyclase domain-containing protein [Noviherbaspirillum saxi]RJF96097.1 adenylate/guanylate cyclase domain-containing protein [Noviherbaspirillum saxi]
MQLFSTSPFRHRALSRHSVLALALIGLMALEMFAVHTLATTELRLSDVFMRRHAADYAADPGIVIVDIDDASLEAMQDIAGLWSWPREIHADLLEGLAEFAPRAVVFDIAFAERDLKRPKSDARLSEAIRATPHVFLSAVRAHPSLDASGNSLHGLAPAFGIASGNPDARAALMLPAAIEQSAWRLGLVNSIEDEDGVLRRYRLHTEVGGYRLPSLPARVASEFGRRIPAQAEFMMRWPKAGHKRLRYSELYRLLTEQRPTLTTDEMRALDQLFRNRIVVIGSSAAGSFDHHLTPLDTGYPGVDILAVAIDNLVTDRSLTPAPKIASFVLGAVLIALAAVAFSRRLHPMLTGALLVTLSLAAVMTADAALAGGWLLPVVTPLVFAWICFLCAALAGYLRERRAREQAVSLFGRFLNPNVVRQIIDQGETVESLSGRTRDITVLFSDIRGFTTLSESRPPQEVVKLLNRYFERQVEVVFRHGGTLDKFIGDCIMAFWGAPLEDPLHARRAVAAALEMQQVLIEFKQELAAEGSDTGDFDVGIGVHTGPAVVGFIGAQRKLDYTAIGDTVNLASRVEGLTKGVARVLVTEDTMRAAGVQDETDFCHHGAFAVKGRLAAVELFEPRRKTA